MKEFRLNRLFCHKKVCVIAVDHGLSYGQLSGLELPTQFINEMYSVGCKNILLNKGIAFHMIREALHINANYILNLSAGLNLKGLKTTKIVSTNLETALKLDAAAVAIQINFHKEFSCEALKEIGDLIDEAYKWQIPVMAMVYIEKGCQINIVDAVRIVEELGVDMLKIARPTLEEENRIFKNTRIPILLAGGEYNNTCGQYNSNRYYEHLREALDVGYKGLIIGRNIFQSETPKIRMENILKLTKE